jgi:hypothetical protein
MATKRVPLKKEAKSMASAPRRVQRLALFGPPLLLEGEDEAAYNELLARFCAAIQPANVIEEMFVADLLFFQWDILRGRRLKSSLLRARLLQALKGFLNGMLDYELYRETFEEDLAEILQEIVAEDWAEALARQCARNEPDAVEKVNELLVGRRRMERVLDDAKAKKAEELARDFARREPDVIKQVNELIASRGLTLDDIMAKEFSARLDEIERIDRLITSAETRRNTSLREIDRHRAVLGEAVRRNLQEVEDAEFEVVETTRSEGKTAA